ncbi:MAG: hypothetical protein KAV41_03050 [Candidatus Pacebacteria bacterium]|nr:hypothetical protein [Candidatus Paceibacterota bacterium]
MENKLSKNDIIGLFILVIVIGLVGFIFLNNNIEKNENTTQVGSKSSEINNELAFDLDLSSLSYNLPNYTKICLPETKQACTPEGKCENIKPTVFLLYDEPNSMIYRCDNKPCDGYEVSKNESGLFTYLEPITPRGFIVKISSDNKYVETVSFGLDTLISYGYCQ